MCNLAVAVAPRSSAPTASVIHGGDGEPRVGLRGMTQGSCEGVFRNNVA